MSEILDEFPGVTPRLCVGSVDAAVDFYREVFGADELTRTAGPDGRVWHCELLLLRGRILLAEERPDTGELSPLRLGGSPVILHAYVGDVDAVFAAAIGAGAKGRRTPEDAFWGDRYAEFDDPSGHRWSIATQLRDLSPEEQAHGARQWRETHDRRERS